MLKRIWRKNCLQSLRGSTVLNDSILNDYFPSNQGTLSVIIGPCPGPHLQLLTHPDYLPLKSHHQWLTWPSRRSLRHVVLVADGLADIYTSLRRERSLCQVHLLLPLVAKGHPPGLEHYTWSPIGQHLVRGHVRVISNKFRTQVLTGDHRL